MYLKRKILCAARNAHGNAETRDETVALYAFKKAFLGQVKQLIGRVSRFWLKKTQENPCFVWKIQANETERRDFLPYSSKRFCKFAVNVLHSRNWYKLKGNLFFNGSEAS